MKYFLDDHEERRPDHAPAEAVDERAGREHRRQGADGDEEEREPELALRRAHVPLHVLRDTIQPFPTFSEIYVSALKALHSQMGAAHQATGGKTLA